MLGTVLGTSRGREASGLAHPWPGAGARSTPAESGKEGRVPRTYLAETFLTFSKYLNVIISMHVFYIF